jgi:hypothetical protein
MTRQASKSRGDCDDKIVSFSSFATFILLFVLLSVCCVDVLVFLSGLDFYCFSNLHSSIL